MPESADTYLHRVGRTGRFGTKGLAITFVSSASSSEEDVLKQVEERFAVDIKALPAHIEASTYMPSWPSKSALVSAIIVFLIHLSFGMVWFCFLFIKTQQIHKIERNNGHQGICNRPSQFQSYPRLRHIWFFYESHACFLLFVLIIQKPMF